VLLCLALPCCGSSEAEPAAPTAPATGGEPRGAACIDVANAAHERKPSEPDSITVSHVLVKHTGSKNPPEGVTRSREDACLRAMEARDKLRGGADFEAVVKDYSDEPGAATRAGTLGAIKRSDVLPPFADAAFELDRAQLSDIVETEFGFHVILRTE
jgi:hypothetical protein